MAGQRCGMTTSYEISRIPDDVLSRVRATDLDASGNPVAHLVAEGGEPMRCCLRNARTGEHAILFGYEPVLPASPYREIGAVFAHAEECGGPAFDSGYPPEWRGRRQVLRAYDARGWIHPSTREHDGSDPDAVIAEMFTEPDVVQIHSRNVHYGCYMFTLTPAQDPTPRSDRRENLTI
jgi:Protein of unknown function (DUF1203)